MKLARDMNKKATTFWDTKREETIRKAMEMIPSIEEAIEHEAEKGNFGVEIQLDKFDNRKEWEIFRDQIKNTLIGNGYKVCFCGVTPRSCTLEIQW